MSNPLTFGSLFAGIGGIDLGFERAGLQCKWQVEIDAYAQKVLAKHWPNVRRHDDVRTWPQPDTERVDIIAGGFPCQDISYAGKGAGLAGERSGLFYEVMRIVSEMGPRIIVLENVAALLTRGLDEVLGSLASLGYDAEWHCIPAAYVGAPHIRDRVFVIAVHPNPEKSNARQSYERNAEQSREDSLQERQRLRDQSSGLGSIVADTEIKGLEGREARRDCQSRFSRLGEGSRPISDHWIVEPDIRRVAHGIPARVDRLRGLGNAVVPQVAEVVGRLVVNHYESITA